MTFGGVLPILELFTGPHPAVLCAQLGHQLGHQAITELIATKFTSGMVSLQFSIVAHWSFLPSYTKEADALQLLLGGRAVVRGSVRSSGPRPTARLTRRHQASTRGGSLLGKQLLKYYRYLKRAAVIWVGFVRN